MSRKRRKANRPPESYVSKDFVRREAQLANLRNGSGSANRQAVTHGGYARVAAGRLDTKVSEVFAALAQDAPLRDGDGGLPAADTVVVRMLAECLCQLEDVNANIRDYGVFDRRTGEVRPAVWLQAQRRREAGHWLSEHGMTPKARAALGVDLTRAMDLASLLSAMDDDEEVS